MKTNEVRPIDANSLRKKTYPFPCAIGVEYAVPLRAIDEAPTLTLNTLRDAIYEDAVEHGLWDKDEDYMPTDCVDFIKDEVFELDCAAMDWEDDVCNDNSAFCDELSDVIIMCLSVSGCLGIDIDAAVRRKMEINRARPWKHGKENESGGIQ